jgi:hypothetical protein
VAVLIGFVAWEAITTAPVREAVRAYTALIAAANRGDWETACALCSDRYRAVQPIEPAEEGGMVGLPRVIHKNFRAWQAGSDVLLCPTDPRERVRPVYRLVRDKGQWKFDGLAGHLERSR